MRQRHYLKIFFLTIVCLSLLQAVSWLPLSGYVPKAAAYSFVIGSDPVDGSTVSGPLKMVRIYFATPISSASQARVYAFPPGSSPDGRLMNAGLSTVNANDPRELDTPLLASDKLPQGGYLVRWSALSTTDGRATSGLIGFNLGYSSTGIAGTPTLGPSTSNFFPQLDFQGALTTAWDWLVLLALCFWAGLLLTDYFIVPRTAPPAFLTQVRKHSHQLQTLCLGAILAGEIINLILRSASYAQAQGSGGIDPGTLSQLALQTNYGHFWLVRVGLLVLALFLLWWRGYRQQQIKDATAAVVPAPDKGTKGFSRLRQQARPDGLQPLATQAAAPPASFPTRSQPRVTGAIAAVNPGTRNTTPMSKLTVKREQEEAPVATPSRWHMLGWLVLAGVLLLTLALSDEVIQLAPLTLSAIVFDWLALAAQAAWFGSLAYLGLVLLPLLPTTDPDHYAETLVNILKRLIPLLFSAIAVFLVSELFLSESTIQEPGQLLNEPYGRALLVRGAFLAFMLIFTCYMFFFLLPFLQRQTVLLPVVDAEMPARRARRQAIEKTTGTIKRALRLLSGLAALTLICLALMNFFAPPVVFPNINYAAQAAPATGSQTQQAAGLTATLQVLPARAGVSNTIVLNLTDAQGNPINNAQVKLSINMLIMDMGTTTTQLNSVSSAYVAVFPARQTFSMAGVWSVNLEIDRPDQPAVHLTFQVTVNP